MRALALFLVAANLAFFAWATLWSPLDAGSDARPLGRQIDPDQVTIVPPPKAPANALAKARPEPAVAACLEWGGFAPTESASAERALEALALGERLTQRRSEETAGWWVFMPPQGSKEAAQKKTVELKALGVEEYYVVPDAGRWRWAISLGVFSTEDAAKSRLEVLRGRGVRTAQIGQRDTPVPKVWYQVRGGDAPLVARLKEIAVGFAGTEVRDCP